MTHTERGVEVALAAGRQDNQHTATGVARVDLQLWDLDVCLKRLAAVAQPAKSRRGVLLSGQMGLFGHYSQMGLYGHYSQMGLFGHYSQMRLFGHYSQMGLFVHYSQMAC